MDRSRLDRRAHLVRVILVGAGVIVIGATGTSRAHHGSHESPLPITTGSGSQFVSGLTLFPRSEVGMAGRFLRLIDPPSGGADLAFIQEIYGRVAVRPWLDVFLAVPVVETASSAGDAWRAGPGDVRAGVRVMGRLKDWLRLGAGVEASLPTGNEERGFGLGAWGTRVSGFAAFDLRRDLIAVAELGASWNAGPDAGLALDQRAAIYWSLHPRLSAFMDVQSRVQLQDGPSDTLAAVRPREAGDTQVTFTPGVSLRIGQAVSVWGGPAIPVGHAQFEMGFVLGASLALP